MSSKLKERREIQNDILNLRQTILEDERYKKASKNGNELKQVVKKIEKHNLSKANNKIKGYKRNVKDVCKQIDYCCLVFTKSQCIEYLKKFSIRELYAIELELEDIKSEIEIFDEQYGSNVESLYRQLKFQLNSASSKKRRKIGGLGVTAIYTFSLFHYTPTHGKHDGGE